jgi:ubiquinone/menaquinone biosynthesis C-methylase UbiE
VAIPDPDPAVHHAARQGFSSAADSYSRGRPDYPRELLPWLRQTLGLGPGKSVVDLGAGTGKFTPQLLATGASVVAVEPLDEMRTQLLRNIPTVTALAGSAQSLPLADESVDAVLCAQAFHWFASTVALHEIGRVLRPGGKLGLVWNVRDESVDWVAAITRIVKPYEGDTPRYHTGEWRRLFPSELFSPLEETVVSYRHRGSVRQVIVERVLSVSFIAALPEPDRKHVVQTLDALIASYAELKGAASIEFPYRTHAYCSTRALTP